MLIKCACGTTSRVPANLTSRLRCKPCGHVFTPQELAGATPEPRREFELDPEDDDDLEEDDEEEDDENDY